MKFFGTVRGIDLDTREIRIRLEPSDVALHQLAQAMLREHTIVIDADPYGPPSQAPGPDDTTKGGT